jgi:hypothetical protein
MTEIIKEKRNILKELGIWRQLSPSEKKEFTNCKSERDILRLQITFRHKYL